MSNVIQLLERLGQDAGTNHAIAADLDQMATNASASPEVIDALRSGDHSRLVALLGARTNVFCAVFPSKNNEDDQDTPDGDDDKDAPDNDDNDTEKSIRQNFRQAAIAS